MYGMEMLFILTSLSLTTLYSLCAKNFCKKDRFRRRRQRPYHRIYESRRSPPSPVKLPPKVQQSPSSPKVAVQNKTENDDNKEDVTQQSTGCLEDESRSVVTDLKTSLIMQAGSNVAENNAQRHWYEGVGNIAIADTVETQSDDYNEEKESAAQKSQISQHQNETEDQFPRLVSPVATDDTAD